jgi:hypothetical protein
MRQPDDLASPRSSFDQHLKVNRTPLISTEAVIKRVIESGQAHVLTASRITAVEKRAVTGTRIG